MGVLCFYNEFALLGAVPLESHSPASKELSCMNALQHRFVGGVAAGVFVWLSRVFKARTCLSVCYVPRVVLGNWPELSRPRASWGVVCVRVCYIWGR